MCVTVLHVHRTIYTIYGLLCHGARSSDPLPPDVLGESAAGSSTDWHPPSDWHPPPPPRQQPPPPPLILPPPDALPIPVSSRPCPQHIRPQLGVGSALVIEDLDD